jgi:Rieske 2Fe-2S family protein
MHTTAAARAAELAASRRPGFTLPQAFYVDPELFGLDLERVFFRRWLMVGHVSRLPEPGCFFLYEIGPESVIVTRDRQGEVHALWNVCRHRGSRVCTSPEGRAHSLACPYHAWTYAADGRLLGAPAMPEDFDRSAYGLKRCPTLIFHGTVFVYLGPGEPPDLSAVLRDLEPFVRPFHLAEAKLAIRMTWEIRANWKLVLENFAECYHCGPAHPQYCDAMAHALVDGSPAPHRAQAFEALKTNWEQCARALGHPTGTVAPTAQSLHCAGRIPIAPGRLSQSRTGAPLAPTMGEFKECDGGYTSFRIHPGFYFLGPCDHAVLCRFTPLAVDRTLQEMLWLVRPDAVEGRDYDPEELAWLWRVTTEQDLRIIEDNQAGVASRAYEPGPYALAEPGSDRLALWYLEQMAGQVA